MKPTAPKKEICSYCGDFIIPPIFYFERAAGKRKGINIYKEYMICQGCKLLLESKGLLDDIFGEGASKSAIG